MVMAILKRYTLLIYVLQLNLFFNFDEILIKIFYGQLYFSAILIKIKFNIHYTNFQQFITK